MKCIWGFGSCLLLLCLEFLRRNQAELGAAIELGWDASVMQRFILRVLTKF